MIAAVIVAGAIAVVLAGVLVGVLRMQATERRQWSDERRALVDRAIARHVGEVLAMDRPHVDRPTVGAGERPVAVGL